MRSRKVLLTLGALMLALGILIPAIAATGYGPGAEPDVAPFVPTPAVEDEVTTTAEPLSELDSDEAAEAVEAAIDEADEDEEVVVPFVNVDEADTDTVVQYFTAAEEAGIGLVLHADTVNAVSNETYARIFIDAVAATGLYGNVNFTVDSPTSAETIRVTEAAEAVFENNLRVIRFGHRGAFGNTAATRSGAPIVRIDGTDVVFEDQQPVIVDGRTLVPVRAVFEQLGFDVDWNSDLRETALTRDADSVNIAIGSDVFTTNGLVQSLDVPASIIGNRTMLPVRAVLESVGYDVAWDEAEGAAIIATDADTNVFIRVAVAVDLAGLDTNNLRFYVFDESVGVYAHLDTNYVIDANGFLHFYTPIGGDIIVTDTYLTQR